HRRRRRLCHPGKPTSQVLAPNDVWSADYKGQFRTGDGRYCYPLTVADSFSRYLLGCQALTSTAGDEAKPIFTSMGCRGGFAATTAVTVAPAHSRMSVTTCRTGRMSLTTSTRTPSRRGPSASRNAEVCIGHP